MKQAPRVATPWGEARVIKAKYAESGALAIQLFLVETDEPLARLSVNLPDSPNLPPGCFFAKTYAENTPIAEACLASGWFEIEYAIRPQASGFVSCPVWRIRPTKGEPFTPREE